jgi:hypothetical protein
MKAQIECTLLDLIQTLNKMTDDDQEVVAMAVSLVNSGRVRLCGNFAGAKIKLPPSVASFRGHRWTDLLGFQAL